MYDQDDTLDPTDPLYPADIPSESQTLDDSHILPAEIEFDAQNISEDPQDVSFESEETTFAPEGSGDELAAESPSERSEEITAETKKPGEVRFGAGVCSHCGGRGYTTYPSSGSQEACWYCSGSGVAH